jgi:hypothetical protein
VGLTTRLKNKFVTNGHKRPSTWTDSLDKRPKLRKMGIKFRTLSVRSVYRAGLLRAVAEEISE